MQTYVRTLCFLLAFSVSALNAQTYFKLNFSNQFNFNLSHDGNGPTFTTMPTGNIFFDSVPFHVFPWTDSVNGWNASFASGSNPVILKIPCNKTITGLNLLSNTYFGQGGPNSYASVQFWGSGTKVFEKMLIGGIDIRDFNQDGWTNTINNTTTTNAWTDAARTHRSDNIHLILSSSRHIDSILIVDNGGSFFQRTFVLAATAENSVPPGNKPGSGNAVVLTETGSLTTSPYIYAGNGLDFGTKPFTCEAWVKRDSIKTTLNDIGKIIFEGNLNNSWGIGIQNNNSLFLTSVGINNVNSTGIIADEKWHHIAVVYTGTQALFYIDGVLSGSPSYNQNFNNVSGDYMVGHRITSGNSNGDQTFDGRIDELRIWNIALTQTQIRSRMCHKIKTSDPLYANLVRYYNFDESSGKTVFDYSTSAQNGTLINNPTRVLSGAAIGNASTNTYGGISLELNSPDSESMKVDKITGSPTGIHIYRVDDAPSSKKGIKGLGPNHTYFGIFPVGSSSINYRSTYTYTGNRYVIKANEDSLKLYTRTSNADITWASAPTKLDTTKNTLITNGDSTSEYILGSSGVALQVPKAVSIDDTSIAEGNSGTKTLKIPVRLDDTAVFNSSVNYTTADSTAKAGEDYVKKSGIINFAAGQLTDTIRIVIKGDTTVEPDEKFKVLLSDPVNISIADSVAVITIKNDDSANFSIDGANGDNLSANRSSFIVSPNPTKDFINIVSSNNVRDVQVKISDMSGKALYATRQNFVIGQQLKVSLLQLPKEVLIITIVSNAAREEFKIVKE
jgi:hypothetical protein